MIATVRRERGMTQEQLAAAAEVDTRTVQRAEAGDSISAANAKAIADALGVESSILYGRFRVSRLLELAEQLTCRTCGAALAERASGDHEWDRFECGAEGGYRFRPCPKDSRFPAFDDYELMTYQEGELFYSHARGRTDMARAVDLMHGFGRTAEAAERWVQRNYIQVHEGSEAAERFLPWDAPR
ncbi:MAG TPA: helix-turn-helix transcriptional regulator [Gemmatimonadaceae bacterium]|nr:helix-turn-helix transcriptional regulator [Gemmatimonadaceae bacterium]